MRRRSAPAPTPPPRRRCPDKSVAAPRITASEDIVKIIFLLVGSLYAIAFAGQYLRTHYVDPPPALPNLLEELREFRDLEREGVTDYVLWTEGRISESQLNDVEIEIRRRREELRSYLR
jgi:hypothetical protein